MGFLFFLGWKIGKRGRRKLILGKLIGNDDRLIWMNMWVYQKIIHRVIIHSCLRIVSGDSGWYPLERGGGGGCCRFWRRKNGKETHEMVLCDLDWS